MTDEARWGKHRSRFRRVASGVPFWLIVAYFLICVGFVGLCVGFKRLSADNAHQARIEASHHADIVSAADAAYTQCVKSIPLLSHTTKFVNGVREVERVLIVNSKANHRATPRSSELYQAQAENIRRLQRAYDASGGLNLRVPTLTQCQHLRAVLLHRQ